MAEVLVTGATGYIASHLIQQLLARGFRVRGTVRSLKEESKYSFLKTIAEKENASDRFKLFQADLLEPGSFDEAVSGCQYVLHTASPFIIGKTSNPQETFVNPAVNGTANVLSSVEKSPSVQRVVLTSSVAAMYGACDELGRGHVFNESDWNRASSLEESPYAYSKLLAERKAWEIAGKQSRYTLVTINPGMVLGPTLSGRNDTASVSFLMNFFNGTLAMGVPDLELGVVDVRDVALAHIVAMESPKANGRYACAPQSMTMLEIGNVLRRDFSAYKLPKSTAPKFLLYLVGPLLGLSWSFISHNVGLPVKFDCSKIKKDLEFQFRPVDQAIIDMASNMIEHGLIPKK